MCLPAREWCGVSVTEPVSSGEASPEVKLNPIPGLTSPSKRERRQACEKPGGRGKLAEGQPSVLGLHLTYISAGSQRLITNLYFLQT